MRIAILDDIPVIAEKIQKTIIEHDFDVKIETDIYTSGQELFDFTIKKAYDILVMDIELKSDSNGMEIANRIKELNPDTVVIFTSEYDFYHELPNYESFRFLPKPLKDADIIKAVDAAIHKKDSLEAKNVFYYNFRKMRLGKPLNQIVYFCSAGHNIEIHTINPEELSTFRAKLDDVEKEVGLLSRSFLRINKSYLINMIYINRITATSVVLHDGTELNVTRSYKNEAQETYFKYQKREI